MNADFLVLSSPYPPLLHLHIPMVIHVFGGKNHAYHVDLRTFYSTPPLALDHRPYQPLTEFAEVNSLILDLSVLFQNEKDLEHFFRTALGA